MSFPTTPAFAFLCKGWDETLLQHPMMKFMHAHEIDFDIKRSRANDDKYYHDDFVFIKSTGESFAGKAGVEQMHADYAMFAKYFHEPNYGIVVDTPSGHTLFGQATIYVDLAAPGGEKRFEDLQGNSWDCRGEGAFLFDVVRDPAGVVGYKFTKFQLFADPTPILGEAIKRGMVPVEALFGK